MQYVIESLRHRTSQKVRSKNGKTFCDGNRRVDVPVLPIRFEPVWQAIHGQIDVRRDAELEVLRLHAWAQSDILKSTRFTITVLKDCRRREDLDTRDLERYHAEAMAVREA